MWGSVSFISCVVCSLMLNVALSAKLPPTYKKCSKVDNECLKSAVEDAVKKLKFGSPELGVPTMDPIVVPELNVGAGSGPVNVDQHYKDVNVYGYSTLTVKTFNLDWKKKKIHMNLYFPELSMKSKYDINGRILVIPVQGQGNNELIIYKVNAMQDFNFDIVTKKNKQFIKIKDTKVTLDVEKAKYKFENLFNGNNELGDNINKVINDNWKDIFDDVKQGYEEAFAKIDMGFANQIFGKVPLNEMFSDYDVKLS